MCVIHALNETNRVISMREQTSVLGVKYDNEIKSTVRVNRRRF